MTKIITALAAAALVGATFAEEIASDNIVGFDHTALRENFKGAGASFIPVGGGDIDLLDLVVTGYDAEAGCEGAVQVQFLDPLGMGGDMYYWYDIPGELYGWYDGNDTPVARGDVTFKAGEGLWVSCDADGYSIQSAGEVPAASTLVTLNENFKMICNPNPVNVDLTATWISGYEDACEGAVQVQILDPLGMGGDMCYWYDIPDELYGWYDGNDDPVEAGAVVLKPGEALWVSCDADGYEFNFPAAIVK